MTYTLKKELGQVFTPSNISRLMALFFQGRTYDEILDPAAGSGSLLEACMDLIDRETKLSAVEIDKDLIDILIDKGFDTSYMNFFDFDRRVDGIIMNPPYIRQELLTSENNKDILRKKIKFKNINSRSNLYLYFLLKGLDIVKEGGRVVAILPNTWLNSEYGVSVQKHILNKYSLVSVIDFEKNVFKGVDVDVSIFVIDNIPPSDLTSTEFCYFGDIDVKKIKSLDQAEVKQSVLQNEILNLGWSFYKLNSNQFKFRNLQPLSTFAKLNRGLTTNYNKFFIRNYDDSLVKNYPDMFKKIINKQNEIEGIKTRLNSLKKVALVIPHSIEKLPDEILSEILEIEKEVVQNEKPKTLYRKMVDKKPWYLLQAPQKKSLIFNYIIRNDVRFILNDTSAIVKDNFYQLIFEDNEKELFYLAVLNSSFSRYFIENVGRSYGSGLLKIQKYELENLLVLDYRKISDKDFDRIVSLSLELLTRYSQDTISKIDKVLSNYYLSECETGISDFYSRLEKLIKGRLNNEN